ncbi:Mitochondrial beta-keto-acyl synthase [Physocladia obscura]|uniref:beta-ketoacyl-[acyl-carrier-protein] synthase I n=1 Tax=Physocladia obscura TaxID=109957 RepID=A0AAD5SSX3_9FUNG|nr:Mitochondrial beta-keto-acyl synthase [Physocladia obscura]
MVREYNTEYLSMNLISFYYSFNAIKSVFPQSLPSLPSVSSTKGATGHLLGAAGAVEAIFTIMAVHTNIVPHTLNLKTIDPALSAEDGYTLDYVRDAPRMNCEIRAAISNSFGFGGTNASLLFGKI